MRRFTTEIEQTSALVDITWRDPEIRYALIQICMLKCGEMVNAFVR